MLLRLVALLLVLGACVSSPRSASVRHAPQGMGYSVELPPAWHVEADGVPFNGGPSVQSVYAVLASTEPTAKKAEATIRVVTAPEAPGRPTLDQAIASLNAQGRDARRGAAVTIAGAAETTMEYTARALGPGLNVRAVELAFVRSGRQWAVALEADERLVDRHRPAFAAFAASFRLDG